MMRIFLLEKKANKGLFQPIAGALLQGHKGPFQPIAGALLLGHKGQCLGNKNQL